MRRKKERSKVKQTRQSNTAHPRQSLFLEKMSCPGGTRTHDTLYSRQSALPTELPRQLSWLSPNLTSHSTPNEQANHQLSMKEKAGVMKTTNDTKHQTEYIHVFKHVHVHVHCTCTCILQQLPLHVHFAGTMHVHIHMNVRSAYLGSPSLRAVVH